MAKARQTLPQLIDSLVPIYAARFSSAELVQLKAFYATPLGKRLVAEMPAIQQESAKAGARWGAKLDAEIMADMMTREMPSAPASTH